MRQEWEREYVEYVTARLPALRRAAYLLCHDPHRADDIVQATTTTLYCRWRRVRSVDSVDAYVHRMMVRKYLGERRLRWAGVALMPRLPETVQPAAEGIEERDVLRAALARLTHAQRTVLVLRYVCDLPVPRIAEIVGCSESNVRSHSSRGLAALREVLGEGAHA
jgi:RNA polymerase sigma-70 factor (sigma-E family)